VPEAGEQAVRIIWAPGGGGPQIQWWEGREKDLLLDLDWCRDNSEIKKSEKHPTVFHAREKEGKAPGTFRCTNQSK
jgi:hypothetical protein